MADGKIIIDALIDASGISSGIKKIDTSLNNFKSKTTESMGEGAKSVGIMDIALGNLAAMGMQKAIDAAIALGKASLQAASDAQETRNVLEVAFGERGTQEIELWANSMIMAFGMSSNEASTFASKFGLMFKDLGGNTIEMSKAFTELSGDLASLYNTDVEQAFTALRSAIVGEAEPLRAFGVFLSDAALNQFALEQGITKTTQQMTEQEKMMLRYNFILNNTTEAQGDAIRSEGSYAKTLKQTYALWEEFLTMLGQLLLPIINGLLMVTNEILGIFFTSAEKSTMALENESKKAIAISESSNKAIETGAEKHYSTIEGMAMSHDETMNELSKSSQTAMDKELSNYEKKLRESFDDTTRSGRRAIEKRLEMKKKSLEKEYQMEDEMNKRIQKLREIEIQNIRKSRKERNEINEKSSSGYSSNVQSSSSYSIDNYNNINRARNSLNSMNMSTNTTSTSSNVTYNMNLYGNNVDSWMNKVAQMNRMRG